MATMGKTQAQIDADRSAMAQSIVDGQNLTSLNDAKRFAKAWIEDAARFAANEEYLRKERDDLLRLLVELRPHLSTWNVGSWGAEKLLERIDARVGEAEVLLEPEDTETGPALPVGS